jgi:hypothetical protein
MDSAHTHSLTYTHSLTLTFRVEKELSTLALELELACILDPRPSNCTTHDTYLPTYLN